MTAREFAGRLAVIRRYSCKCSLCKQKWTTEIAERGAAYAKHGQGCAAYQERFAKRRLLFPRASVESEQYQMSAFYFQHFPIKGHYNPAIKCDGRCMGATGHNCECSCGGANHGISSAA